MTDKLENCWGSTKGHCVLVRGHLGHCVSADEVRVNTLENHVAELKQLLTTVRNGPVPHATRYDIDKVLDRTADK